MKVWFSDLFKGYKNALTGYEIEHQLYFFTTPTTFTEVNVENNYKELFEMR